MHLSFLVETSATIIIMTLYIILCIYKYNNYYISQYIYKTEIDVPESE